MRIPRSAALNTSLTHAAPPQWRGSPLQTVNEGFHLAQQLAALPFKAARELVRESPLNNRPIGTVIQDSLTLGEGMARLPFKAASALLSELADRRPNLEERVATLERRLGVPSDPVQPPES